MRPPWKIWPGTSTVLPFSQEWMQYLAEPSKVVYQARDGTEEKVFDAPVSYTG